MDVVFFLDFWEDLHSLRRFFFFFICMSICHFHAAPHVHRDQCAAGLWMVL